MNAERYTDVYIDVDLLNSEAQEDGSIKSSSVSFCKSYNSNADLYTDGASNHVYPDYMSVEFNYNILDGTLPIATFDQSGTRTQDILFVGEEDSIIQLDFSESQSSIGFILYFLGDYPSKINVQWLQYTDDTHETTNILIEKEFSITSPVASIAQGVSNFDIIVIEILDNWIPNRFTKMYYVQIGINVEWTNKDIQSATLVQELNLLADKLSLNTLTFKILDANNDFNYGNINNIVDFFERLLPVHTRLKLDDTELYLGDYYLNTIKSDTNLIEFNCFSILGLLDTIPFNDGDIYNGTNASVVLQKIFEVASITNYYIHPQIGDYDLYGTLAPCTCRQALQQILFVSGGVLRTESSEYQIIIDIPSTQLADTVNRGEKITTSTQDAEYVTGVEINYNTYTLSNTSETIVEQATYNDGEHIVVFSKPYSNVQLQYASGSQQAINVQTSAYYVKFKTPAGYPVTLSITGKPYENKSNKISVNRTSLKSGALKNVKTFSTTLCDYVRAFDLANDILKYFVQSTLDISIKQFSKNNIMIGKQIIANEVPGLENYVGRYTSRTFDLTGGFVDDAKLVGYYEYASESDYFMDNFTPTKADIYSGDDILI